MDKSKKVFDLLGFQYKPLEKKFLEEVKPVRPDIVELYNKASYSKKIVILDHYASFLGF